MKRLKLGVALIAALSLAGLAGCSSGSSESGTDTNAGGNSGGKQITIGYVNWDEGVAVTHLWQKVLEDKGYDVKIEQIADAGPTYVGLAKGDIDLFFDGSLPTVHGAYWKKYGDQLTDISTWYDSVPLTIAVPTYMKDINSVADLKTHADEFDSTITGIESGAGETGIVKKKLMPQYGLGGWTLKTSSTASMLAALKKATDAKLPIVVDLWHPHWAYTAYPIKDLKEPKGAMGKPDSLHALGTSGFADHFPEVDAMLKKFHMDDAAVDSLEQTVLRDNKNDMAKGVDQWLKANPGFEASLG